MNLFEAVLRRYYRFIHKLKKAEEIGDTEFLNELRNRIKKIDDEYPLGTTSWEQNRRQIRKNILKENLNDFANWEVIQRTMFYEAPRVEYNAIKKSPAIMDSIEETKVGNPRPYFLNKSTSGNLVHHAYSLLQIIDKLDIDELQFVVELGGGYGSMCRLFRNTGYKNNYTIFDLPEFLILQEYFLHTANKEFMNNTLLTGDKDDLTKKQDSCLLLATWSLSEMPLELREELLECITFDYCLIAFQSTFDNIDNLKYFEEFRKRYQELEFSIEPIEHLKGHYYLVGSPKQR